MANEDMKEFDESGVAEELPGALAMASPHRQPTELRGRVLRAAEARAGRSRGFRLDAALFRPLGAIATLILVTALIVWNLQLQQGLADERTLLQQLRENARESVIFEVVDSPGSQKEMLRAVGPGRPGEDPPYGKVYTNANHSEVVVMGGRLPNPVAGHEYRLYLTDRSGAIVNVGVLKVDASGFGYLIYQSGMRGPAYPAARLYLQPSGATSPGGTLVLAFTAP
ncbi:MAG TPA: anti-sigma factor [Candidatus Limnocylindria bacterium]|jgi:hypothetical protein|nr:anti-sigma factor [Candidatus Limnocylindria bacterium]